MKYSSLIEFEPLTTVIKLADATDEKLKHNVETYVFSEKITQILCELVVPNLSVGGSAQEQKGISVVGSYGTGKSHLMSVISAVAENASMLQYINNDSVKQAFETFAGQYKVLRFEVGTNQPLFDLVCYRIEKYFKSIGVDFKFDPQSKDTYKEQLQQMMAAFEEVYPDKHFLIVIDELLEYLKSRNAVDINSDLMTLRQLGEVCDGSRFKIIYGVQELLYRDPQLAHAADALNKVQARFEDVLITKEDVAFVVKNRLLKKTTEQKQKIREHLNKFSHLFDGLNTNLNDFVELFPVHPSYIAQFQQIKHGKDKREILKILSNRFSTLMEQSVPEDNPGLITYDSYFEDLKADSSLLSIPDIATIKDKVEVIDERINGFFVQARAGKKPLAKRIANALAIKALCDDLDKHSGASAYTLKEDLCVTLPGMDDAELLKATIETVADQLQKATQGQYVAKEEQTEDYYIRSEGGINVDQIVKDYAESVISKTPQLADANFFNLLKQLLGIETNPYRTGFNIWAHELEWKSTKSFRRGYIFFGNPNERSTTEPIQEFYVYFCPLFGEMARSDLDDEVYYDLTDFSEQFKNEVCLYAAAIAKMTDASSDQKKLFQTQVEDHQKKVRDLFNKEFVEKIKVFYKGKSELLRNYQLPPEGGSKLALFSDVAAKILDAKFNSKFPDYPKFSELLTHITSENLEQRVKSALTKIVKYNAQNRDGQAILQGLGLAGGSSIDVQNSKYANAIKQALINKGAGKVLNREEVIYTHYQPLNQYYSVDYKLEYQLEFVVLAALVFTGDIEICWNGDVTLTSQNLESVLQFPVEKYYLFNSIKQPSGLPIKALKKLFISLGVGDLTGELQEASTFTKLATATKEMVDKVVRTIAVLQEGVQCNGNALIDAATRDDYIKKLGVLQTMLDTVSNLDTKGKLNGFKNTEEEITAAFGAYPICDKVEALKIKAQKFETLIRYLDQAKSYVVQSETPLFNEMDAAIAELPQKLQEDDKSQKQYEAKLNSLKDSYADYYLKEYQKNRLSYADGQKRDKLLNSPKKLVCDIIKDVTVLTKTDYENWLNTINSLKVAEDVTKQKIKENPYHDFSPRENYNKPTVTIRELEEKLDSIYEKWVNAMKATFKDPEASKNMSLLAEGQQAAATQFKEGKSKITQENAATIRDVINELSKGFDKVELNNNDFADVFSKPLTVDEAKKAFEDYLEKRCSGKERSKIRIILSGK